MKRFELLLQHPSGARTHLPLAGRVVVGTSPEAHHQVTDEGVDPLHARFEAKDGAVFVTDLASDGGTFVADQAVSRVRLGEGEEVRLGTGLIVRVVAEGAPADPAPAAPPPRPQAAPPPRPQAAPPPRPQAAPPPRPQAAPPPRPQAAPPPRPQAAPPPRPQAAASAQPASEASGSSARRRSSGSGRSARVAPSGGSKSTPLVLAAVGVLLIAGIVALSQGDDGPYRAKKLYEEAQAAWEVREGSKAIALLERIGDEFSQTPIAGEAAELLTRLEADVPRRRQLQDALGALHASNRRPAAELQREQEQLLSGAKGLLLDKERGEEREALRLFLNERADRLVREMRLVANPQIADGHFATALQTLDDAGRDQRLLATHRSEIQTLRDHVEGRAEGAARQLLKELASAPRRELRARLEAALVDYAGTGQEGLLRARLTLLAQPQTAVAAAPRPGEDRRPAAPPPPDLLEALGKAEGLSSQRCYAAAATAMREAAEIAPSRRSELEARAARFERMGEVVTALAGALKARPAAFRQMKLSERMVGQLLSVDAESIVVRLGPGARATWKWSRLKPGQMMTLLGRMRLEGELLHGASEMLLEAGAPDLALRLLASDYAMRAAERAELDRLVAEARGMDAVPAGGFTLTEGSFLTSAERAVWERRRFLAGLSDQAARGDGPSWVAAAEQLAGLGDEGRPYLEDALQKRRAALQKGLEQIPQLSAAGLAKTRMRLFGLLEERRKAAFALIFDTKRYPYPYGPNQAEVQAEVDQLTGRVREIWETPSSLLEKEIEPLKAALAEMDRIDALDPAQVEVAGEQKTLVGARAFRAGIDERIGMKEFAPDATTRKILEHRKAVFAYNDSLKETIRDGERGVLRVTNLYRLMMGLKAVMSDDRLVLCARGHSQEMKDRGYFAHNSPVPGRRSPSDRARLAGWGGGVSENILRGQRDPKAVVSGWLHSSGHHRNILGRGHTHLGVGSSEEETFWTQNFAKANQDPPR